ncbi:MAG TPA: recombinase family protein [Candidatus Eisenbergiella merdavium]|uniref:Recombinase family protein n=1 Tax=Candidatus Eisenbergiella merdavium TaxID=2838551 RepID=A0A9D2SQH6_9FIRM|nr:recombinase family protein [Candidatus Eisenbergiella merdavium]
MTSTITDTPIVIDGYVRLSRDDNKRNYSSIENQKKIIQKYAEENNMIVRHIYEDDGISGYSFNRPDFQNMMSNLNAIDVIVAKDLSRIGRHNAKVLLFLEEMEEQGKRVILIDDNYDSLYSDDDIIGIKTWDNERHVKNTSRKVKRIKKMEQENGTLKCAPPFGYTRHPLNKQMVLIDEEAAAILNLEKDLYLEGNGIRRTAEILSERGVPTPTMLQKERYEALGLPYNREVAYMWSYGMVKDTLFNDYHNGILRTHKRERATINGKDKKVPKDQQYVFYNHHPKIFDDDTMKLLFEVKDSRHHSRYRGQRKHINIFSGCLYCKDCGMKLTAINRPNRGKYYVCGTYNKKGKQFCGHAHLVTQETLVDALIKYLTLCRDSLADMIQNFDLSKLKADTFSADDSQQRLEIELEKLKKELKTLVTQKIKEITANPDMNEIINETYASLQADKMERISAIEKTLQDLTKEPHIPAATIKPNLQTALDILNEVLEQKSLTRTDIEVLVEKIIVDKDGNVDIYLKHGLGNLAAYDFKTDKENLKLTMLIEAIRLLEKDETGFTSVKFLSDSLKAMGYPMHRKKFVTYMEHLLELGLVEKTGIYHYPYRIVASRQKLRDVEKMFIMAGQTGGMPEMVFEYILKKNGIDPQADLSIDQSIDFGSTAAAFSGGQGDFTVEFEPHATLLEQKGDGYVVASLGEDSGYVPYTAFSAKKSYIDANPEVIRAFTAALQKGMDYVQSHSPEEIAAVIQPQFEETDAETITTIVTRYYDQDSWKDNLVFEEDAFTLLQNILEEAGELEKRVPYEDLVDTGFAEEVK